MTKIACWFIWKFDIEFLWTASILLRLQVSSTTIATLCQEMYIVQWKSPCEEIFIASYFIPAPAGPLNHLGYLYRCICICLFIRICTVLLTMWGDVASCTCWTTLCICIWVFVFLFVFLYLCISILHLCIFICPFVFSYSANHLWGDAAPGGPPCPMQQWIMITLCDAPAQFAYSITISPCLVHTLQYYLAHTWSSSFILTQEKYLETKIPISYLSSIRICLGLSLGCGSAAHWSTMHRAFIVSLWNWSCVWMSWTNGWM